LNGRAEFEAIAQFLDREMPFRRGYGIMRDRGTLGAFIVLREEKEEREREREREKR